jgi:hypothetical protein
MSDMVRAGNGHRFVSSVNDWASRFRHRTPGSQQRLYGITVRSSPITVTTLLTLPV